jgi:fused signal recognition particle receptor
MFNLLRRGYEKIRSLLGNRIRDLFQGKVDEAKLEQLEEILYQADLGVATAALLTNEVRDLLRAKAGCSVDEIIAHLQGQLEALLAECSASPTPSVKPMVTLVVGVNGNGKTTSVAKLAKAFLRENQRVILGAADTFRAAAIDQLKLWGRRIEADVIAHQLGSDPSAVAFDAVTAGVARGVDHVLIDTAGRLHTKSDLMQELAKIRRVCNKVCPGAPHETLLVLDATTGQNGVEQAKVFHTYTPITGVILTKLDGTARGGIVVAVQRALGIPVKFIGIGEGADDLRPFEPRDFVRALLA